MITNISLSAQSPEWLDSSLYPFQNRFIELQNGKMHYIDEGEGEVLLFIHGTPTWSFLYRDYIQHLSKNYRCIAIDHIGFGLSEKNPDFDGSPQSHSQNLEEFIEKIKLPEFTIIVHDFGGPIGMSYANSYPEKIKNIVLFNTWLWGTKDNPEAQKIDRILNSSFGKFLYLHLNFSPRILLKKGFFDSKKLTKTIHKHYKNPFPNRNSRLGLLSIGKSLLGSSDWYEEQWNLLDQLEVKPFLILWGSKDEFIGKEYLEKWRAKFKNAEIQEFECGHFVQEEMAEKGILALESFLEKKR